jgi:hypothetical protein
MSFLSSEKVFDRFSTVYRSAGEKAILISIPPLIQTVDHRLQPSDREKKCLEDDTRIEAWQLASKLALLVYRATKGFQSARLTV